MQKNNQGVITNNNRLEVNTFKQAKDNWSGVSVREVVDNRLSRTQLRTVTKKAVIHATEKSHRLGIQHEAR